MEKLRPPPELASLAPGPMVPAAFAVVAKRQDTVDVWTLELEARSGVSLQFAPGQFTMLAARGAGEVPVSISGDPDHPERLIHTVRAVGLATEAICSAEPGEVLSVRGPFGAPWPVESHQGADVLIAAGGIGLPPLRPAILQMLGRREHYGRIVLLYGGRGPDELLFTDELEQWKSEGVEVTVTVDSAGPEWVGHVGVVTRLIRPARLEPGALVAMACGAEVMMRFVTAALLGHGVRPERLYVSMERNMQCGIGHCGHCQLGPTLVCRDGPVHVVRDGAVAGDPGVVMAGPERKRLAVITTPHEAETIREIRASSETLITIGACATSGGIQALRNFADVEEFTRAVYATPEFISTLASSTAISANVTVDYELQGCPVDKHQLLEVLSAYLNHRRPRVRAHSVCIDCKRRGTVCVMVAHGTACLGPVTHAGCGAICPRYDRGCYGCYGPKETPNTQSLNAWSGLEDRDLVRIYRTYNAATKPFQEASERHEHG